MNKHIELLKQLLIKYYNKDSNKFMVSWELADEELRLYRIEFMVYDYLKN